MAPGLRVSDGTVWPTRRKWPWLGCCPARDVTVHVEPAKVRGAGDPFALVQRLASEHGLAVHNVHILHADTGARIELHVELPGDTPYAQAYARVGNFEAGLGKALPGVEVLSHLEPENPVAAQEAGAAVSVPLADMAWEEIRKATAQEPLVSNPHRFATYTLPEQGVCLSFHCGVNGTLSVEEAHTVCNRLEQRTVRRCPWWGASSSTWSRKPLPEESGPEAGKFGI